MMQELIRKNRSYRSFDRSVKISDEQLRTWVDCARLCPSTRNLQALKFRLVQTERECAEVLSLTRWAGLIKDQKIPPAGHEPVAYLVVCIDTALTEQTALFLKDVGIVSQSILLCATEEGFGGCMIGSFSSEGIRQALKLPVRLAPQLILALGKPDEQVELTDTHDNIAYYRENGIHYVPKRSLDDLIV